MNKCTVCGAESTRSFRGWTETFHFCGEACWNAWVNARVGKALSDYTLPHTISATMRIWDSGE